MNQQTTMPPVQLYHFIPQVYNMVQICARNAVRASKHLVSTDRIFVELLAVSILAIPALLFIQKRLASRRRNRALQTFHKFIDSYSSLDTAVFDSNLASTFTHVILPKSLNIPTRDLTTFKEHSEQIFDLFERFAVIPHHKKWSVFYCEESETVIAHCKMGGKLNRNNEKVKGFLEARMGE